MPQRTRRPIVIIAALVALAVMTPLVVRAGLANADGLARLRLAYCSQFDVILIENYERREEPALQNEGRRDVTRSGSRQIVAGSPLPLEGDWFESFGVSYSALGPSAFDLWLIPANIPLDRDTRVVMGLRGATLPAIAVNAAFANGRQGTYIAVAERNPVPTNLSDTLLGTEDARDRLRWRDWRVVSSEDLWQWARRVAGSDQAAAGARITGVGIMTAVARDISVHVDQVTVWRKRDCP